MSSTMSPGCKRAEILQVRRLRAQMLHHGFVQAGAIAVSRPVKHGRLKIVMQLHQAAAGAFDHFQRRARERRRRDFSEKFR